MNRLDLIIDALERTHKDVFVMKALVAARELRAMKPEGISPINGASLYALDEVKHD